MRALERAMARYHRARGQARESEIYAPLHAVDKKRVLDARLKLAQLLVRAWSANPSHADLHGRAIMWIGFSTKGS